jgi:diguanylate cyclase (GGDEF)-like protein
MTRGARAAGTASVALTWTLLVTPGPAVALDPTKALTQYVQNIWRVEEGLPHNTVRAIRQTRDGYLWLGTFGGLARFDGVRFQVYDRTNSVLTNNEIRCLHEDAQGVLWVGTSGGGLYRLENGQLHKDTRPIESQTINAILSAPDGSLLVGTGNGLYRLSGAGRVERFTTESGLWGNTINALAQSPSGKIFAGTENGVSVLQGNSVTKGPQSAHSDKAVLSVLLDRAGNLYVGGRTIERYSPSGDRTLAIAASDLGAFTLFEDKDGVIWVGLYGGGIGRLEADALKTYRQEQGFLDRRGLAITEDREGGLWIGTRGGVVQLREGTAVTYSLAEGFAGNIARTVFEDKDGAIYVGFEGGVSRFFEGNVTNITTREGLPHSVVKGVLRDRAGHLWIGTDGGLAEEIAPGQFRVHTEEDGLPRVPKSLYEDRSGRLWVGGDGGIGYLENGRGRIPEASLPLSVASVQSLYEDRDGWLWIGTLNHGAWRLKNDVLERVPLLGLTSIGVRSFFEDPEGAFFVGTIGSGLFIRPTGGNFRQLTTAEGLGDDSVWSILDDGHGQVWMSSDRGVFRVPKRELIEYAAVKAKAVKVNVFVGSGSGLKSRECNGGGTPPGLIARDGRVVVPTGAGVAFIDPSRLVSNAPPPPARIEEVVADRVLVSTSGESVIPPGRRDTEIHFTGLSFLSPANLRFRYRLAGHDNDWIDAGNRRVAYYGGLTPGRYEFRVLASNDGATWSPAEDMRVIVVKPLWYQTMTFKVGAGAVVLSLLAGAFAWRVRLLNVRARELSALVSSRTAELAERTRDLEVANATLGRLAITDDLTGIPNHRQLREFLDREWARCARNREPISMLMCDIDDFKAYNDTLGHQAGDACLRAVARALNDTVRRAPDLAARYGGEEFAAVLPATDSDGAAAVADSIREALHGLAMPHPQSRVGPIVTMSIGVATLVPAGDTSVERLIAIADEALYAAKTAGRDRSVVALSA